MIGLAESQNKTVSSFTFESNGVLFSGFPMFFSNEIQMASKQMRRANANANCMKGSQSVAGQAASNQVKPSICQLF